MPRLPFCCRNVEHQVWYMWRETKKYAYCKGVALTYREVVLFAH